MPDVVDIATEPTQEPAQESVDDRLVSDGNVIQNLGLAILEQRAPRPKRSEARPDRGTVAGISAALGRAGVTATGGTMRLPHLLGRVIQGASAEVAQAAEIAGLFPDDVMKDPRFVEFQAASEERASRFDDPLAVARFEAARDALPPDAGRVLMERMRLEQERESGFESHRLVTEAVEPFLEQGKTLDRWADAVESLRHGKLLYKSPSLVEFEGRTKFFERMLRPQWWAETAPEYVGSALSVLLPAASARRVGRLMGMSERAAMRVASRTAAVTGFGIEGGTKYDELRSDLVENGYTLEEAESLAAQPAFVYGIAAAWAEYHLIPLQLRRAPGVRNYVKNVGLSSGVEGAEEVTQELMGQVSRLTVGLDPTLTWDTVWESMIGGMIGGLGMTSVTNLPDAFRAAPTKFERNVARMTPLERLSRIQSVRDQVGALRENDPESKSLAPLDQILDHMETVQRRSGIPTPSNPKQTRAGFAEEVEQAVDQRHRDTGSDVYLREFMDALPPLIEDHPTIERVDPDKNDATSVASQMARRLGLDVVLTTGVRTRDGTKITGYTFSNDPRTILMTEEVTEADAIAGVITHEFTHTIENDQGTAGLWNNFRDWVAVNDSAGLDAAAADYYAAFNIGSRTGQTLEAWQASPRGQSESIARYIERRAGQAGLYSKLAATNVPLLRRIRDTWRRLRNRIGARFSRHLATLDRVDRFIESAIQSAGEDPFVPAEDPIETAYQAALNRHAAPMFAGEQPARLLVTHSDMMEWMPAEQRDSRPFENEDARPAPDATAVPLTDARLKKVFDSKAFKAIEGRRIDEIGRDVFEGRIEIVKNATSPALRKTIAWRMPSTATLLEAARLPAKFRFWYEDYVHLADAVFHLPDSERARFNAVVSATSQRTTVEDNILRTIAILSEYYAGAPPKTDIIDPISLGAALDGSIYLREGGSTLKTGNFNQTYEYLAKRHPTPPLPTVDTIIMQQFGLNSNAVVHGQLYKLVSGILIDQTNAINAALPATAEPLKPWQWQALLWMQWQKGSDRKTFTDTILFAMDKLEANGINIQRDSNGNPSLAMEDWANPRIATILRPIKEFSEAFTVTLSTESPVDTAAKEAFDTRSRLIDRGTSVDIQYANVKPGASSKGDPGGYDAINIRAMASLVAKGPGYVKPSGAVNRTSIMTQLVSGITGITAHEKSPLSDPRFIRQTRSQKPRGTGGIASGPIGSAASGTELNARIPLQKIADPSHRRSILMLLGRTFGQQTMADSRFTFLKKGDTAAVETWGAYVKKGDPTKDDVGSIRAAIGEAGDASVMTEVVPGGAVVYVTPDHSSGEPATVDRGRFEKAVQAAFADHEIVSHRYGYEADYISRVDPSNGNVWSDGGATYDVTDDLKELEDAESSKQFLESLSRPQQAAVAKVARNRRERRRLFREGRDVLEGDWQGRFSALDEKERRAVLRVLDQSRLLRITWATRAADTIATRLTSDWRDYVTFQRSRFTGEGADPRIPRVTYSRPDAQFTGEFVDEPAVRVEGKVYTGLYHLDAFENAYKDLTGQAPVDVAFDVWLEEVALVDPKDQGFTTSKGRYLNREESAELAKESGQIEDEDAVAAPEGELESQMFDANRQFTGEDTAEFVTVRVFDAEGTVIKEETFPDWEAAKPFANEDNQVDGHEVEVEFPHGGGKMKLRPGKQYTGEPSEPQDSQSALEVAWGAAQIQKNRRVSFDEYRSRMLNRFGNDIRPRLRRYWHESQEMASLWEARHEATLKPVKPKTRSKDAVETKRRTTERARVRGAGERAGTTSERKFQEAKGRAEIAELKREFLSIKTRVSMQARQQGKRTGKEIGKKLERAERDRIARQLKDAVKRLPKGARVPASVITAKTNEQMERAFRRIDAVVERFEHDQAVDRLEATIKDARKAKLRPGYDQAVDAIIHDVDLQTLSEKKRLELSAIQETLAQDGQTPLTPGMADALRRLDKVAIRDLPTSEIDSTNDSLSYLMKTSRDAQKLINDKGEAAFEEQRDQAVAELSGNLRTASRDPVTGRARGGGGLAALPFLVEINAKPDLMAEIISGGDTSTIHEILYKARYRARRAAIRGHFASMDWLQSALEGIGIEPGSETLERMSFGLAANMGRFKAAFNLELKEMIKGPNVVEKHRITLSSGRVMEVSGAERAMLLAQFQDPSTLSEYLGGAPISLDRTARGDRFVINMADVDTIRESATDHEIEIADEIVRHANTVGRDIMRGWSIARRGYDNTSDDIHVSRRRVLAGQVEQGATFETFGTDTFLTADGMTKERVGGSKAPIVVEDIFVWFSNYMWKLNHIAHLEPAVANARRILNDDQVRTEIDDSRRGAALTKYWKDNLNDTVREAVGGPSLSGPVEDRVARMVNQTTKGILAANPFVALYQIVSVISAGVEMGGRFISAAVLSGSPFNTAIDQRMRAFSPPLRERIESGSMGILNESSTSRRGMLGFTPRGEKFMMAISFMDRAAIRTIWRAAELQVAAERPSLDPASVEYGEAVAELAEGVVNRTQPMFDALHSSGLGTSGRKNSLVKAVTMFFSQRNQNVNMVGRAILRMRRGQDRGAQLKSLGIVLMAAPLGITLIKAMRELVLGGFDDEEEKRMQEVYGIFIDSVVGNMYFGDFLSATIKPVLLPEAKTFDIELSPTLSLLVDGQKGITMVGRSWFVDGYDEDGSKAAAGFKKFTFSAMAYSGFQITPLLRMIERAVRERTDEPVAAPAPRRSGGSRQGRSRRASRTAR